MNVPSPFLSPCFVCFTMLVHDLFYAILMTPTKVPLRDSYQKLEALDANHR